MQKIIVGKKIVEKKGTCGGVPILEGTRIRVSDIAIEYDHRGLSPEEIASEFSISAADVFSALKYYYEHPLEIRKEIKDREERFKAAKHNDNNSVR